MQKRHIILTAILAAALPPAIQNVAPTAEPEATAQPEEPDRPVRRAASTMSAPPVEESPPSGWIPDQVMVRVDDIAAAEDIAADVDAEVYGVGQRSALVVLQTGPDQSLDELVAALRADERVRGTYRHAQVRGAGKGGKGKDKGGGSTASPAPADLQWHIDAIETPSAPQSIDDIVVAVLDTGVAYEARFETDGLLATSGVVDPPLVGMSQGSELFADTNSGLGSSDLTTQGDTQTATYLPVASLSGLSYYAPWDFVSGDAHPNDDHQHGTHITSTIASSGEVSGIAPGVSVMPLKVLDANNVGTELGLIEAVFWAADHGADVINMSLTFGPDYVLSPALADALAYAWDSGAVLVAATGNNGGAVGYPAASPLVIGVGGACLDGEPASYSSHGPPTEVLAPGGCIDQDRNGDGYPDGILAESIGLQAPTKTGYWWYAGTSQAAAVVSGAAAHLLADGADPAEVRYLLQASGWDPDLRAAGHGAGHVNVDVATSSVRGWDSVGDRRYSAALLPWLRDNGDGTVSPSATLTVMDGAQDLLDGAEAIGTFHSAERSDFSCILSDGTCTVEGAPIRPSADGDLWEIEVSGVVVDDLIFRPEGMAFASDDLDDVVADLQRAEPGRDILLAWYWDGTADADLGRVAESYSMVNMGTGIATSPFGVIVTPPRLSDDTVVTEESTKGTGIATSPFGYRRLDSGDDGAIVVALSGTGIATSPFSPIKLHTVTKSDCTDCLLDGTPILLGSGHFATTADVSGTALFGVMESGGFVTATGYQGASWVTMESSSAELLDVTE